MRWVLGVLVVLAVGLSARSGIAQDKLRVVVKPVEPFAFEQDGRLLGYSIDLWDRIAREAKLEYELTRVETVPELLEALRDNRADVGVGALSITAEREGMIDFTHPFYEAGLQILVGAHGSGGTVASTLRSLLTWDLVEVIGLLVVALLGTSHLLWWFERKKNEEFPPRYRSGLWESLWWTICVLITGGCENKAPIGVAGRLVAIVWMIAGILLVSYITASVTTVMTVNTLSGEITGPADLPGRPVATVVGSTAEKYLRDRRVDVRPYPTIDQAYDALTAREVKAVVYDAPILLYRASRFGDSKQRVIGPMFEKQNYGIGLQRGSPHRKPINEAMLRLNEAGFFDELQKKWFGGAAR